VYTIEYLIQQKAYELGYEKCGIIPIHKMEGYRDKMNERQQKVEGAHQFYQGQKRLINFSEEYPWAKSVVVMTVPYSKYKVPASLSGHIAKSYLFDIRIDERTKEYQNNRKLDAYMQELGLRVVTNQKFGVIGMRWAAMQAGLGVVRRNNFFYTESGSWVHLEAWLTDYEMELKEETKLKPCPKGCDRCIRACPTVSLSEAYTMNPVKCISFLTTFGGRDLPHQPLTKDFGECIYGCDICQDVCPMNHKKWIGDEDFPGLSELVPALSAENILKMDEAFYKQKIQPKFFYLSPEELWKWQVNALNYMDNRYHDQYKPLVLKACKSKYEKVREMANAICEKRKLYTFVREVKANEAKYR
jgi:epoxyqueuosine reductase